MAKEDGSLLTLAGIVTTTSGVVVAVIGAGGMVATGADRVVETVLEVVKEVAAGALLELCLRR